VANLEPLKGLTALPIWSWLVCNNLIAFQSIRFQTGILNTPVLRTHRPSLTIVFGCCLEIGEIHTPPHKELLQGHQVIRHISLKKNR
jgi:hypothetical protein